MFSDRDSARVRALWQIAIPLAFVALNVLTSGEKPFPASVEKPLAHVFAKREVVPGSVRHTFRKRVRYQQLKWSTFCRHTGHMSNPSTLKTSRPGSGVHFVTHRALEICLTTMLQETKLTTSSSVGVVASGITENAAVHMVACANCRTCVEFVTHSATAFVTDTVCIVTLP